MGNISQTPFLPAPAFLAPEGVFIAATSTGIALPSGSAVLSFVELRVPVTINQMRCTFSGTPTGNVDMGIYDATGSNDLPNNLLGHTGINVAATGSFTKSLTANLSLNPGQYWIALLDTVADSVLARGSGTAGVGPIVKTSATNLTVLPATIGAVANTLNLYSCFALIQNGWS
jgi:hypothetical protein